MLHTKSQNQNQMKNKNKEIILFVILATIKINVFVAVFMGTYILFGLSSVLVLSKFSQITFHTLDAMFVLFTILIIPVYIAFKIQESIPIPKYPFRKNRK